MISISFKLSPCCLSNKPRRASFCCRAESNVTTTSEPNNDLIQTQKKDKTRVIVVGSGWAGLGAAHHLCKQGFDVTVVEEAVESIGGQVGSVPCNPDEVGIQGFWYPYRNIFSIVDELGIKPFTNWLSSAHYSSEGIEVVFPIFQEQPQLPTPLGSLAHTQLTRLPQLDLLTLLPLMAAVVDFDNSDAAWRRYDPITARELLRQLGCSERLYRDVIDPLLEVRLFAPAEQCSAAATLAVLYYYVLAHQKDLDKLLCRGTVREQIFEPWKDLLRKAGCEFRKGRGVTDFFFSEETGCITEVVYGNDRLKADAVILAVGISALQDIIKKSSALCSRDEFLGVLNLNNVDAVSVKLRLDTKVELPKACNTGTWFNGSGSWAFFNLNEIYDEHQDDPATVLQADFYCANKFLPLSDEQIASKVISYLSKCVRGLENVKIVDKEIRRYPKSLSHLFPGSYTYMLRGSTSFPNLFMAGDWIINRHGSWAQEKSYVTGLEAANLVIDYLEEGSFAKIIPVEGDEPHIEILRTLNKNLNSIREQLPWSGYFLH
ncbi:hypothetical protein Droror1_Dr00001285 [Drosera rotundifolia]